MLCAKKLRSAAHRSSARETQDEKALLSDLACMLLSNMSKLDAVSRQILGLRVPFSLVEDAPAADAPSATAGAGDADASTAAAPSGPTLQASNEEIAALDLLLEVFLKGEGKKYNPNANYDFLASVFANVSLVRRLLSSRALFP